MVDHRDGIPTSNSEAQLATARRLSDLHGLDDIEIRAPESATSTHGTVTADWARRFPSEQVWRLRRR